MGHQTGFKKMLGNWYILVSPRCTNFHGLLQKNHTKNMFYWLNRSQFLIFLNVGMYLGR